ncbi:MAG: hypothetical protein E6Q97_27280 [Desulfurellales bacterium]|nr:MAG: hypothetical protein E6Q97_27280 [Desulfurellales bacterium]
MTTSPSRYQQVIFDAVASSRQPLVIEATAGSGKTTTLTDICTRLAPRRCLVVAFNKAVAETLTTRLPPNAKARTLHSFGLAAWKRQRPDVVVNPRKVDMLIEAEVKAERLPPKMSYKVSRLVKLARTHGLVPNVPDEQGRYLGASATAPQPLAAAFGTWVMESIMPDTQDAWGELGARFDVLGSTPIASLLPHCRRVLHSSIFYAHVIDYDDMLYLPTLTTGLQWHVDADVVLVDELQDLDQLQRKLVTKIAKAGAQFVGVGDSRQAIYSFRGAGSADGKTAIELIADELSATRLPLSICYRCPTSHLTMARWVEPRIEARDGADVGTLLRYGDDGVLCCDAPHLHDLDCDCLRGNEEALATEPALYQPGDVIVSRAKAPLVKVAYWLLRRGVKAMILGRDIGQELHSYLISHVKYGETVSVPVLIERIQKSTAKLVEAAVRADEDVDELTDRRDVLVAVLRQSGRVDKAITALNEIFGAERRLDAVCLSTIHKFKGGEADRVWWLDYHKPDLESPRLKHEWQRREAENLRFVASTRSRSFLGLIKSSSFSS